MTQAKFERIERQMGLSEKLETGGARPGRRQTIVELIGAEEVDIRVGGKKTRLEVEGDKKVLHIARTPRPPTSSPRPIGSRAAPRRRGLPGHGTPVEKAAYHKNELTHLEDLRKRVQDGEAALDDFTIDTKIRKQFAELERTLEKLPPDAKGRHDLAEWATRFRLRPTSPRLPCPSACAAGTAPA